MKSTNRQTWVKSFLKKRPLFVFLIVTILGGSGLSYLTWKSQSGVSHVGWLFDKKVEIRVWANYVGRPALLHLAGAFYRRAHALESELWLSKYGDSDLARFNRASQSRAFTVSPFIPQMLSKLKPAIQNTLGVADPTHQPLIEAFWPSANATDYLRTPASPPHEEVENLRPWLGIDKLQWSIEPPTLAKSNPHVYLDFGPWISAVVAEELEETAKTEKSTGLEVLMDGMLFVWKRSNLEISKGARSVLNRLDVREFPKHSGAFAWIDFVQAPRGRSPSSYFQIVEPRTLAIAESDTSAAAVFCNSPLTATTWTRAAMILGSKDALKLAEENAVPLRLRTTDGKFHFSMEWKKMVQAGSAYPVHGDASCVSASNPSL